MCILNSIQSDLKGKRSKVASSFLQPKTRKLLICQLKLKKKWNSSLLMGEEIPFFSPWHFFLNVAGKMYKEIYTCHRMFRDQKDVGANDWRSRQSFSSNFHLRLPRFWSGDWTILLLLGPSQSHNCKVTWPLLRLRIMTPLWGLRDGRRDFKPLNSPWWVFGD